MKNITILGSTGSIGTQTLDVIRRSEGLFNVNALTVNRNIDLLEEQIKEFNPKTVVVFDEVAYQKIKKTTSFSGNILCGLEGLNEVAADTKTDLLVSSLVGFAGVEPTLSAIRQGTPIALANKETLVAAGEVITHAVKKYNSKLLPVDSEHSAIFQCLQGEEINCIQELILTASGGPFFLKKDLDFATISVEDALNHPNWDMGNKVTIDSATMMNKGLEVIEAYWLFNIPIDKIKVLVHPQSIVHSLIRFKDTSLKAQLGMPDMRMPISYTLNYPKRLDYDFGDLDMTKMGSLDFFEPDFERFPCLKMAFEAVKIGGSAPTVMNAANEIAVEAFLKKEIKFSEIMKLIAETMNKTEIKYNCNLQEIIEIDKEAKLLAMELKKI